MTLLLGFGRRSDEHLLCGNPGCRDFGEMPLYGTPEICPFCTGHVMVRFKIWSPFKPSIFGRFRLK